MITRHAINQPSGEVVLFVRLVDKRPPREAYHAAKSMAANLQTRRLYLMQGSSPDSTARRKVRLLMPNKSAASSGVWNCGVIASPRMG